MTTTNVDWEIHHARNELTPVWTEAFDAWDKVKQVELSELAKTYSSRGFTWRESVFFAYIRLSGFWPFVEET